MKKINCPACDSSQVYTLQDGTIVCRHCGVRTTKGGKDESITGTEKTISGIELV